MTSPTKAPARWILLLAFGCVYFFWGSTFVAIRYGVQYLTPGFVSGFRYLAAGAMLLLVLPMRGVSVRINRRDLVRALVLGLLMLTGNNVLLGWAEMYVTAGYAALLTASVPILIAMCESLIPGGAPLNRMGWAGSALGLAGLIVLLAPVLRHGLVLHHGGNAEHALALGTMVLVVGIACWVVGSLLSGRWPSKLDPFVGAAWQMLFAGTANVLIGTAAGGWHTARWTPGVFVALAWLAIFGSLVGYTAYTYLLHHVPVAKVATYAYVNPIVAVVLSALFLHEGLHGSQWVAMAIILVAVAIVTASKSKPKAVARTA
ncbi:putative permease, DMT superfamily [Terriglobus roseus DSM 18391]|uniref:Putative permease, DMT superfamily n=1 Tax=Terriglobus roseus (strain DSM 18391 / NRRL B-41598 / KBS 63) TaxID=926566 RepID=I3ZCP0_TERRK|nr:EamA family transporter [Terriglobus roseus]AFL87008.1 putative permease, DMT superfamily [Terriglobus roseus DSM 18391]